MKGLHVTQFLPLVFIRYHQVFTLNNLWHWPYKILLENTAVTNAVLVIAFLNTTQLSLSFLLLYLLNMFSGLSHRLMFNVSVVGGQCASWQEHVDTRYCPNSTPGELADFCCCSVGLVFLNTLPHCNQIFLVSHNPQKMNQVLKINI